MPREDIKIYHLTYSWYETYSHLQEYKTNIAMSVHTKTQNYASTVYMFCNLGICAITRLCCALSESGNCMSISQIAQLIWRLHNTFAQSQECVSAICERNTLTSESIWADYARELRALRDGEALNRGTPQAWGLSALVHRPRGREFLWVGELLRSPWRGGLEYMPDIDGDNKATRAPYVCYLPYTRRKVERLGFSTEFVQSRWYRTISGCFPT